MKCYSESFSKLQQYDYSMNTSLYLLWHVFYDNRQHKHCAVHSWLCLNL